MLFYGSYMSNVRLKWRCLLFLYILCFFDLTTSMSNWNIMIMWLTWLKCPCVNLIDLISLVYIFIKYQLLEGTKLSFLVHLEFLDIRHKHMINLKESTLVDESIKCLRYKTLRYIKANPYVHPNWICNTIYTLLLILVQKKNFTFNELWINRSIGRHMLWVAM